MLNPIPLTPEQQEAFDRYNTAQTALIDAAGVLVDEPDNVGARKSYADSLAQVNKLGDEFQRLMGW